MFRYLRVALCLCLGLAACSEGYVPPPEQIAADAGRVTDPREIVVLTRDSNAMARLLPAAGALGYGQVSEVPSQALGLSVEVLSIPPGRDGPAAIAELEALVPGIVAGVNHAYDARNETRQSSGRTYADQMLRWPEGGCSARHPVGVIDAAPAATARAGVTLRRFARGGRVADDHGWLVADLIADPARLTGAGLYMADVVGQARSGRAEASVDAIVAALAWMQEEGVGLVNISLAGPYNKILDHSFAAAAEQGMIIVAAVGNEGPSGPPRFPAAFPQVIAVTAVDADGTPYARALRGPHVTIAAPGVDIYVGGRYVSGTSFAAPFVTAFLASRDLSMSDPDDARRMLRGHVRETGGQEVLDLAGSCG